MQASRTIAQSSRAGSESPRLSMIAIIEMKDTEMNLCGSWGLEFHVILEEQTDMNRNRSWARSLEVGWMDDFINRKHILDNLKKKTTKLKTKPRLSG